MSCIIEGIDIAMVDNDELLGQLLDELELDRVEERKAVRARLQAVKQAARAERETRSEKFANSREESIQKRQAEAIDHKKKTLEMYDQMAKSSPAGAPKVMNVNILRGAKNNQSFDSDTFSRCSSISESGLLTSGNSRDLVEETIRDRQKAADTEKQRILAAYDAAAKSGPAGTYRVADLKGFRKEDAANFQPSKPTGSCTFGSSGGIPIVSKKVSPARSASPASPSGSKPLVFGLGDTQERLIRERQKQMEDNKKRILSAYDAAAKTGIGPKTVILSELPPDAGKAIDKTPQTPSAGSRNETKFATGANVTVIKQQLLKWAELRTRGYQNVAIENFSASWADGMAFCALIHSYFPDAFDFNSLKLHERRKNLELAFNIAQEKADIYPLLDVEDMLEAKGRPDWKSVFTYVQAMHRSLRSLP